MRNRGGVEKLENQAATIRMARLHRSGGAISRWRMMGHGRVGSRVIRAPAGKVMPLQLILSSRHHVSSVCCFDSDPGEEIEWRPETSFWGNALGWVRFGTSRRRELDVSAGGWLVNDKNISSAPRVASSPGTGMGTIDCNSTTFRATGVCRST